MTIYEMFVQMWILDFKMGLFGKDYFQSLVQAGQLQTSDYATIVGEAYVAPQSQHEQSQA